MTIRTLEQSESRIAEHDLDPEAFAALYYPYCEGGRHSYPVLTTMERERERASRKRSRLTEYPQRLASLERELAQVEKEVRAEVARMRPSPGRVPWPKPLPALEGSRARFNKEFDDEVRRDEEQYQRQLARDALADAREDARQAEREQMQDERYAEQERRRRDRLSPEARDAEDLAMAEVRRKLASGEFRLRFTVTRSREE